MAKRQLSTQMKADRALCPVPASQSLGLQVATVARAMRKSGVTQPITLKQARVWRSHAEAAPEWMQKLLADAVTQAASRAAAAKSQDIEDELLAILLEEEVEQKLLAHQKIRGAAREEIAADFAFRSMKDLVRSDGDISELSDLHLASLRWAGVRPADRPTWFLTRGDG